MANIVPGSILVERSHRVHVVGLSYVDVGAGVFSALLPWCSSPALLVAVMLINGISMGMVVAGESTDGVRLLVIHH